jgi:hypothetical protein
MQGQKGKGKSKASPIAKALRTKGDGGIVHDSEESSEDDSDESDDENGRGKSKASRTAKTLQVKDDSSSDSTAQDGFNASHAWLAELGF